MTQLRDSDNNAVGHTDVYTPTQYTATTHTVTDDNRTVDGHDVTFDTHTETTSDIAGKFDDRVKRLISEADANRKRLEDVRANRRNRNRFFTLLGAMLIGLTVVWGLQHLGPIGAVLAPYSFVITVLFDSTLTLYAYIRKY